MISTLQALFDFNFYSILLTSLRLSAPQCVMTRAQGKGSIFQNVAARSCLFRQRRDLLPLPNSVALDLLKLPKQETPFSSLSFSLSPYFFGFFQKYCLCVLRQLLKCDADPFNSSTSCTRALSSSFSGI